MQKTKIPLVLSSDNYYAPFMYTTILSILQNAKENTFYDFYLIVHPDFSNKRKTQINKLQKKYNCNIKFIDMTEQFNNYNLGWHVASWYRLLLANILPETIDKCIFLDCDVCVRTDLTQLYNTVLNDNYLAGVLLRKYNLESEHKNHCKILNIPSMKQAINAGVVIYNLKQIRNDNITQRFIELLGRDWPSFDQDIMNNVCYGKIKLLPPKYNAIVCHLFINGIILNDAYTKEEIEEAKENPLLIHFLEKPWVGFRKYWKYWWQVAIKTPYKFYFIFLFVKNVLNPIPKIKNIINNLIPKSIKDNFKKRIKLFVRADITNEIENNIISVKEQLDEQKKEIEQLKKIILEQNNEIENLKQKE